MTKKKFLSMATAVVTLSLSLVALADRHHDEHMEPRARGVVQHGMEHHIVVRPGAAAVHAQVFHENRSIGDIRRDPHIVVFNHVGWHPAGHWDHWYRDWGIFWRVSDWGAIRTVTCEAVNTQTQFLYPVSEARGDGWVWNPTLVNNVAARALDECAAEAGGNPAVCSLVQGECWNSIY